MTPTHRPLGYGDFHLLPDLVTLRRASWLEKSALVLCDVKDNKSHIPMGRFGEAKEMAYAALYLASD